ncbi:MAG: MazG nucleotide pyrophosphohydrolase domain-containing protein [Promethearchaeota archaeon]
MRIREFQELMRKLYFHQDSKRGLKGTYIWLIEEIGELASILKENAPSKEGSAEELADIIAWTCSIANLLNIDLENALFKKYPDKCIKCGESPCICNKI